MASPDVVPYVDLTLYDKNPQDIYDTAVNLLKIKLPDWIPREGNTEVLLLESLSLEVAELVFAVNRVPSAVVEVLLRLYKVERDAGAPPTTTLTFNMAGTQGYTIPIGTAVQLTLEEDIEPVVFVTTAELVIAPGFNTGTVAAVGLTFTAGVNGMAADTEVEILDSVIYVDSAVLGSVVVGGRDPEQDADYFVRGAQRLSRLTDTLVLPRHFVAASLEEPYVTRAVGLDNYTPVNDANNNGPVGVDGGHITVALYGENTMLTAPQKAELLAKLVDLSLVNLAIHVMDPTINTVPVTVQVRRDLGYDDATVIVNVTAALNSFLSVANWNWSTTLRRNELIQVIGSAEGVSYVETLTSPAADLPLTGVAPLVIAGTLTVTTVA